MDSGQGKKSVEQNKIIVFYLIFAIVFISDYRMRVHYNNCHPRTVIFKIEQKLSLHRLYFDQLRSKPFQSDLIESCWKIQHLDEGELSNSSGRVRI